MRDCPADRRQRANRGDDHTKQQRHLLLGRPAPRPAAPLEPPDYLFDYALAIDPQRAWAYAGSWDGPPSHVLVLDRDQVIATLPVGFDARHIAVDPTHDYVYVADRLSGAISVIRGTEVITHLLTGGVGPSYISVDEQRGYIYVSNADSPSIAVFGFDDPPADKPTFWQALLPWLTKK